MTPDQYNRLSNLLTQLTKSLGRIGTVNGSKLITGVVPVAIDAQSLYIREDTVVAALTGTGPGSATSVDIVDLLAISGKTLVQGDLFTVPSGYKMSSITLTSGSAISY